MESLIKGRVRELHLKFFVCEYFGCAKKPEIYKGFVHRKKNRSLSFKNLYVSYYKENNQKRNHC